MALGYIERKLLERKARDLGFPQEHFERIFSAIGRGSKEAEEGLKRWVSQRDPKYNFTQSRSPQQEMATETPEKDYFSSYRKNRDNVTNKNGYGFERYPGQENDEKPSGDFLMGTPEYNENIPLVSRNQSNYMNSALDFSADKLPNLYNQWGDRSNRGVLDELFGNNASKGFEDLLGGLGEYLPSALASGAGSAVTGGGLGGILQALIGSAAGQYAKKNAGESPLLNNISSGIGNYYNQGMSALGDLYNNRGQFRR
jgi:hypothetical protein